MCRHGSEPAVSLTYSDKSSTSATISLGVGDEMTRYHPGEDFENLSHFKHISYSYTDFIFFSFFFRQGHLEVIALELLMQVLVTIIDIIATAMLEKVSDISLFRVSNRF